MKSALLTFLAISAISVVSLAQSTETKEREKKSSQTENNVQNKNESVQDSASDRSNASGRPVEAQSNSSDGDDKETVTQKEKRNLPGKRSQVDENETGKERKKAKQTSP